ncbi:beta-ketoacyl synthase chain length factor [Kitasatospora sp. NPDC004240]
MTGPDTTPAPAPRPGAPRVLALARWPDPEDERRGGTAEPPPLPGFSASTFNPLVAAVAERCLSGLLGPAEQAGESRTALLLASGGGDRATARAIDAAAASGRRVPPLLFFQSNPNAVLGHLAARWRLTGPVVAIGLPRAGAPGEVPAQALESAELLLADGDADRVLLIAAEQGDAPGRHDHAVAVLLAAG